MTGDDLKRLQDTFFSGGQAILRAHARLAPIGFIVTMSKHVDKLFEHGWAMEILDRKMCMRDPKDDAIATLIVDLSMDWKKLYHSICILSPQAKGVLEPMINLAKSIAVDDPYKRVVRPFLERTNTHTKDVMAATMRHICDHVDAFASIFQCEVWFRSVDGTKENEADVPRDLSGDAKAIEAVYSTMETYEFTRMLTLPIHREPSEKARDEGKVIGFGDLKEDVDTVDNGTVTGGRFTGFLKPLSEAS